MVGILTEIVEFCRNRTVESVCKFDVKYVRLNHLGPLQNHVNIGAIKWI
jgi:hypothetical protein